MELGMGLILTTVAFFSILLFVFWPEILSYFSSKIQASKDKEEAVFVAERISRVKALSDNTKDIEQFITSNASILSEAAMNSLIERLSVLKDEKVIAGDSLKYIIDALEDNEVETQAPAKKARR